MPGPDIGAASTNPGGSPLPSSLHLGSPRPGRHVLAIVGGNTPFILPLLSALAAEAAAGADGWDVRVHGRDESTMRRLAPLSRDLVGSDNAIAFTTSARDTLAGADVVLVQPRVGGWAARAGDEGLAEALGVGADEGLGIGGLRAALRSAPVLRGLGRELRRTCPEATIVAFSNPLSTTTSLLHQAGCVAIGVCELPTTTVSAVASALGVDRERLTWSLVGLNHRAFLHDLRLDGQPVLDELVARAPGAGVLAGVPVAEVARLGAVPLKYHQFLRGRDVPPAGRANLLAGLRETALRELDDEPGRVPPSLKARSMPWYEVAVVPVLRDLAHAGAVRGHALEVVGADGVARSTFVQASREGWVVVRPPIAPGSEVAALVAAWTAHEVEVNRLLAQPTTDRLRQALECDPTVPPAVVPAAVAQLSPDVEVLARRPIRRDWSVA